MTLPSWNDGAARTAILDYVERVTTEGGPDFVPPPERIAVFDNDGTLWCEKPGYVQAYFLGRPASGQPDDRAGDISGAPPVVPNQGFINKSKHAGRG